jgi:hypothetical protein
MKELLVSAPELKTESSTSSSNGQNDCDCLRQTSREADSEREIATSSSNGQSDSSWLRPMGGKPDFRLSHPEIASASTRGGETSDLYRAIASDLKKEHQEKQAYQNARLIESHYPKDIKLGDIWTVLHNYDEMDSKDHDKRISAIALRVTDWITKHAWDVSDEKKKVLHEKVLTYFNMPTKATAKLMFECVVRQDKKDKQGMVARALHYAAINTTPFGHDKLQSAKKELVRTFGAWEERSDRINRKKTEFDKLSWQRKIFRSEGGYRYGKKHNSEIKKLDEKLRSNETYRIIEDEIKTKMDVKVKESKKVIGEWYKKYSEEGLSDEQRKILEMEGKIIMHNIIYTALRDMDFHQQTSAARSSLDLDRLAGQILEVLQDQKHGVFANLGVHLFEQGPALAALIIALKAASHGVA